MEKKTGQERIVIVSNRLPIVIKKISQDRIRIESGTGGLVTAMAPVLKNRNGTWIGWPGYTTEDDPDQRMLKAIQGAAPGYAIKPVLLNQEELKLYYEGFSNSVIWPLFHGFTDKCRFLPEYWDSYCRVNEKFTDTVCQNTRDDDFVWVHDYQLLLVGSCLDRRNRPNAAGFFLHIPFPPAEVFSRCPWRYELLSAMLSYKVIGFHTILSKRNFIATLKKFMHQEIIDEKAAFDETVSELTINGRRIRIGVFPISIDYDEFSFGARDTKIADRSRAIQNKAPGTTLVLGVDRLDYTKGIPEKLRAFKRFLTLFPQFCKKVCFIQVVVPSRREIEAYADLKRRIEQMVGEINGLFSTVDWIPVHYMFRSLDRNELIAMYRACDIGFVTPLKDGMNLVAKEYCACNIDETGVLILSEFAGAAQQFNRDALLVNPHDINGTAAALKRAFDMSPDEKRQRMHHLRKQVKTRDVMWWVDTFLRAAIEKDLIGFSRADEYFPEYRKKQGLGRKVLKKRRLQARVSMATRSVGDRQAADFLPRPPEWDRLMADLPRPPCSMG